MKTVLPFLLLAALVLAACGEAPKKPAKPVEPLDPRVMQLKTLSPDQQKTLAAWLKDKPGFHPAEDQDCQCDSELDQYRLEGPFGRALPHYRPYLQKGDFNTDGYEDIAIIFINDDKESGDEGMLTVFNGPFTDKPKGPAFAEASRIVKLGLVYSPDDGKGLGVGHFEAEYCPLEANGATYAWNCDY